MEKSYKANLLEIEKIGVKFAPERGGGFLTGIKYGSSDIMRDAYNRVHDWATQYTMHKKEWHGKFVEDWLYNAPKSKSTFNLTVNTFNLTETDLDAFIKWRETPQGFRPKGLQTEEELMLSFFGASRIGETYRGFPEGEKVIKTASLIPNVEFQHWIHNGYAIERVPYNYTFDKKRQMFVPRMANKQQITDDANVARHLGKLTKERDNNALQAIKPARDLNELKATVEYPHFDTQYFIKKHNSAQMLRDMQCE